MGSYSMRADLRWSQEQNAQDIQLTHADNAMMHWYCSIMPAICAAGRMAADEHQGRR
jgi:hypothetical protein